MWLGVDCLDGYRFELMLRTTVAARIGLTKGQNSRELFCIPICAFDNEVLLSLTHFLFNMVEIETNHRPKVILLTIETSSCVSSTSHSTTKRKMKVNQPLMNSPQMLHSYLPFIKIAIRPKNTTQYYTAAEPAFVN